jgi:multiple sugar transport system permease protein
VSTASRTGAPSLPRGRSRAGTKLSPTETFLLVIPALLPILILSVAPLARGIYLAFTDSRAGLDVPTSFIGVANFRELLHDDLFVNSFKIGLIWATAVTALQFALALGLALLLSQNLHGRWLARSLVLIPWAMPPVVVGIMWKLVYQPQAGDDRAAGRPAVDRRRSSRGRRGRRRDDVAAVPHDHTAAAEARDLRDHRAGLHLELQLVRARLRPDRGTPGGKDGAADAVRLQPGVQVRRVRLRRRARLRDGDRDLLRDDRLALRTPAGDDDVIVSSHPRRSRSAQYGLMALYVLFLGFPLLWMLSVSLKGPRELVELYPSFVPNDPTLENYRTALQDNELVHSAVNSLKIAVATALVTTVIGLPASYVLARQRGLLSTLGLAWILISQMFPLILIIIPLFLLLRDMGLTNSHLGLVLVYTVWALPFVLWMQAAYVRAIPRELEEAARADGATRFQVLVTIVAPLLAPGIVVTTLFAFILAWNEFFFALVVLQTPDLYTLPLKLKQFIGAEDVVRLGPLAAASLLATLPSLVLFAVIQRRLTRGLLSGAVKG